MCWVVLCNSILNWENVKENVVWIWNRKLPVCCQFFWLLLSSISFIIQHRNMYSFIMDRCSYAIYLQNIWCPFRWLNSFRRTLSYRWHNDSEITFICLNNSFEIRTTIKRKFVFSISRYERRAEYRQIRYYWPHISSHITLPNTNDWFLPYPMASF